MLNKIVLNSSLFAIFMTGISLTLIIASSPNWLAKVAGLLNGLLFCGIAILIMGSVKFRHISQGQLCLTEAIWQIVIDHYPFMRSVSALAVILSLTFALLCCFYGICYGMLSTAFGAAIVGKYQLGEYIFCAVPFPRELKEDMSLVTLSTFDTTAPKQDTVDAKDIQLNEVVAHTYGSTSSQMAHRYSVLAGYYSRHRNFIVSNDLYEKSILIYKRLNLPRAYAEVLSEFANSQAAQGNFVAASRSNAESYKLVTSLPAWEHKERILNTLANTARTVSDTEQSKIFLAEGQQVHNKVLVIKFVLIIMIVSISLTAGAMPFFIKYKILQSLSKKWKENVSSSSVDLKTTMTSLSNLITVELYKRNFAQADIYSKQLMSMVEAGRH